MNFQKGQKLYKHELLERLGKGHYGQVWRATDHTIGKEIALKILHPTFTPLVQVLEEARVGNRLDHANLCPVHYADVVKENGQDLALIAMEYFPNGSVSRHANTLRFLPLPTAIKILCDVLCGLEHLHDRGIFHNDIKPSNILLDNHGRGVLADFGTVAVAVNNSAAVARGCYGAHQAPEVDPDARVVTAQSDIYQVGVTTYRFLNGMEVLDGPFAQLSAEDYRARTAKAKIPDRHGYRAFIPQNIKMIVNKAMAPNPSDRFESARQMRTRLEGCRLNGYWTSDDINNLVGVAGDKDYRFELIPVRGHYRLTCWKKARSTGREVHVSKFCAKKLSKDAAEKMRDEFMLWVVKEAA